MTPLAELLRRQAIELLDMQVTEERAPGLAEVVSRLNNAVASVAPTLPFDRDATTFYALLYRYREPDDE